MYSGAYLESSQTSMIELFCKNNLWLRVFVQNFIPQKAPLYVFHRVLKSLQSGVADFNYFLPYNISRFLNKIINVIGLLFNIQKTLKAIKQLN